VGGRDGGDFGSRPHAADGRHRSRRIVRLEPRAAFRSLNHRSRSSFSRARASFARRVASRRRSNATAGAILNRRCPDRGRGARARVDVRVVAIARAVDRRRRDRARRARARGRARAARPRTRNTKSVVARASREGNFLDTVYHASRPPSRSRRARARSRAMRR